MDRTFQAIRLSSMLGKLLEWDKWTAEIPHIRWPYSWHVKAIPPHHGTIIRYHILDENGSHVSVYLDCYDILGYYGKPHWEIYPDKDGDNLRFDMNDLKGLLNGIKQSFKSQKKLLTA